MENYVKCVKCGSPSVLAITKAEHISSSYLKETGQGYIADNDDSSWRIKHNKPKTKLHCNECCHEWKTDKHIYWQWTGT